MNRKYLWTAVFLSVLISGIFFVFRLDATQKHDSEINDATAGLVTDMSGGLVSDSTKDSAVNIKEEATSDSQSMLIANPSPENDESLKKVNESQLHEKEKGTNELSDDALEKSDTNKKESPKKSESEKLLIQNKFVNFGFSSPQKTRTIDTIILHSSYDAVGSKPYSVSGVIQEWKDAGVSPHYLIDRDGVVYQLVKDADIAYHAGVSRVPDGRNNVNDFSIGIEILNTKTDEYTDAEYASARQLISFLKNKYDIKYVLGHDDIAPERKTDPWNFDWKRLK